MHKYTLRTMLKAYLFFILVLVVKHSPFVEARGLNGVFNRFNALNDEVPLIRHKRQAETTTPAPATTAAPDKTTKPPDSTPSPTSTPAANATTPAPNSTTPATTTPAPFTSVNISSIENKGYNTTEHTSFTDGYNNWSSEGTWETRNLLSVPEEERPVPLPRPNVNKTRQAEGNSSKPFTKDQNNYVTINYVSTLLYLQCLY